MAQATPQNNIFAVIDLGSNSFHMMIAKYMAGGVHTIGRVKRKVRLAAGLDENNVLSLEAMERGWECLALFAERLQDIPKENIRIVATATMRLAINADVFIKKAELILDHQVNVISGEEEACTIYKGVAHTSACQGRQLVIDIGGASTEVVIGKGFDALLYKSLNMGCVTFLERYFQNGELSESNFNNATNAAKAIIAPIQSDFKKLGWELAIGASGTVQAIQEIQAAQGQTEVLTLENLKAIQSAAVQFDSIGALDLPGLSEERRLVFVSGLAILIALFESLEIQTMGLAGGALREGVLYSMIPDFQDNDIRKRTLDGLMQRYHVDKQQAERVAELANSLASQVQSQWCFDIDQVKAILNASACLHEIGLIIDYKLYHKHSAYILKNSGMPGFSKAEKQLITAIVDAHRIDLSISQFEQYSGYALLVERLVRIMRLAVVLSMRRQNDVLPEISLKTDQNDNLTLCMDSAWLIAHPLMQTELEQEGKYQRKLQTSLKIERQ
ncbi:guanosine-5'-triphosphate,3'-diphosphate diphosphatase [Pseudoalteromonas xiamenensis]|uniref:Guanosine-5'-triphosphate,3'-diphosphate pyrophosphatase n=1 Tax=Pseudoalteromonas xiamenensis TaxID=882626 RepID=A0A975HLM9_9GAMM|nr:guanosine-5'-triphosphate,3'-diphosphate diphosphatase [Pseudoalteromonas xiamenensis]QTH70210.1 guanosine-5'-triphosphate,3'-diphosphate diphosphatase [Pseudoalteromonas xiamenensis]